ncbi:hypothetical protein [Clostridium massiliamazoniense]|uniref:hypothetical protein n=1 Tax=Clostridium massiliamazoniense TaxID=1347366 RepID=UPI0006D76B3A|nr:hypothetical protein [Clostridium massiliamazoniense]
MKSDKVILNALMELNGKIDNITTCLNISNEKTGHKILFALIENENILTGEEKARQFPLYANINEYWKVFSKNQKNSNIDLISLALYEFIKKYAPETFKEVDLGVN